VLEDAFRLFLKAYKLTSDGNYLNAAKLAGYTFLYNMRHKPSEENVHAKYNGGFAAT
jgi:exosome complex RNA-binding protein Rrp42 (RNase PH superfamily)